MTDPGASQLSDVSGAGPVDHTTNRVLAAVNPQQLSALVTTLIDAGYAPIGILAGEAGLRQLQQTAGKWYRRSAAPHPDERGRQSRLCGTSLGGAVAGACTR